MAFDGVVLGGPLAGTLLWLRSFWSGWRQVVWAWVTVSPAWIALDALSVARGWWWYNAAYSVGPRWFGLPVEEVAFFFIVPFATTVLYYAFRQRIQGFVSRTRAQQFLGILAGLLTILIFIAMHRRRTIFDCVLALSTIGLLWRSSLVTATAFWYWNAAVLMCCLVFDAVLTAAPVFWYDNQAMTGVYFGTIPLEDVIYNFSFLNIFLWVWQAARRL